MRRAYCLSRILDIFTKPINHMTNTRVKYRQWVIREAVFRRRRRKKSLHRRLSVSRFDSCGRVRAFYTKFIQILDANDYVSCQYCKSIIDAPESFSFKKDFDGCILFYKEVVSSFILSKTKKIIIRFAGCKHSSIACFSLLEVILADLDRIKANYNRNRHIICNKEIVVERSEKSIKTNKYLHAFLGIKLPEEQNDGSRFLKLPMQVGKRKNYKDNPKTRVSSTIVQFVNHSVEGAGVTLKIEGRRAIEGLIGEVLGNAEDHSEPYSEWYVDAISFAENQNNTDVIELNLSIMNVGPSMYEGFEATKKDNVENYSKCQKLYDLHRQQFTIFHSFNRESLFTLYMLDDGISRLKYQDESHGNGTTRFLESFISLGSFGAENPKFNSQLNVISGHSIVTCDNQLHAVRTGNVIVLPLNNNKDFKKLPEKEYLSYNLSYFPGTILECHIYLNKDYFEKFNIK